MGSRLVSGVGLDEYEGCFFVTGLGSGSYVMGMYRGRSLPLEGFFEVDWHVSRSIDTVATLFHGCQARIMFIRYSFCSFS